ncbi:PAS domain-containing protein [Streptomyces sp. bgisy100]|uniref:PAS domain-containing protein n=1 Tax=Streptomyces sp. bgisy100 TaxID=3413783 RepID=UPI003D75142F
MSSRPSRGAARLAAILDALPDALLLVNCNGTVVNANTIALETFESPGTALVGRGLLDLLPSFDSKRIPGSMRRPEEGEEGGRTKPTRMVARRTDGTEFPVEVTSANLEDGRTPYADPYEHHYTGDELLMLVVRDLTGTVDTEAELARQQRQTEMILRAAAEGVVGVDTEGRIVLVNPSAAQILGYRAGDLGGRELHPLLHHSRPDGSPLPYEESPLADSLRSGRKHRVRGQVLWAKDGRAVPVDLTTAPVRDGDQLVGAVMTFTDRRQQDALAARHAQLLAVLGESLRGPLEQLRGELGTLAADPAGQLWPEANQILHYLTAGYARMTTLVDNVLRYQRLDEGSERLELKTVELDAVVAAGVEGAIELIGPGRAQFAVHAPPIEAEVDPERLAQALAHLVADVAGVDATGNAPAGGSGDSTIVVAAAQRGEVVRIEVRGPYAGGDPVHEPIVRGIVRRHGGVLQTHEVPGAGGSAYVLEVPIAAGGAPAAERATDRDRENATTVMPVPKERARGTDGARDAGTDAPATPTGGRTASFLDSGTPSGAVADGRRLGTPAAPAGADAAAPGGRRRARPAAQIPGGPAGQRTPAAGSPVDADTAGTGEPGGLIGPPDIIGPEAANAPATAPAPESTAGRVARPALPAGAVPHQQSAAPDGAPAPGVWGADAQPEGAPVPGQGAQIPGQATPDNGVRPTGRRRGRPSPAESAPGDAPQPGPEGTAAPGAPQSGRRARRGGDGSYGALATAAEGQPGPDAGDERFAGPNGRFPGGPNGATVPPQGTGRRARPALEAPGAEPTDTAQSGRALPALPAAPTGQDRGDSWVAPAGRPQLGPAQAQLPPGAPGPAAAPGAAAGGAPAPRNAPFGTGAPVPPQGTGGRMTGPQPANGTSAAPGGRPALPAAGGGAPAAPGNGPAADAPGAATPGAATPGAVPADGGPYDGAPAGPQQTYGTGVPHQAPPPSQPAGRRARRALAAASDRPLPDTDGSGTGGSGTGGQSLALPPAAADRPAPGTPAQAAPAQPAPAQSVPAQPDVAPPAPTPSAPAQPVPGQPAMAQSAMAQSGVTQPGAAQPSTAQPGAAPAAPAQPGGAPAAPAQTGAAQPGAAQPAAAPAGAAAAGAAQPGAWSAAEHGRPDAASVDPEPTPPQPHPLPTGRRRGRPSPAEEQHAPAATNLQEGAPAQGGPAPGMPGQAGPGQPAAADPQSAPPAGNAPAAWDGTGAPAPGAAPGLPQQPAPEAAPEQQPYAPRSGPPASRRIQAAQPLPAEAQSGEAVPQSRAISVRTLGQGVPFAQQIAEQQRQQAPAPAPGQTSGGSGRRRKLAAPPEGARTAPSEQTAARPRDGQQQPRLLDTNGGRAYAIGAPDEGAEGPEPLDGPNGAVDVTDSQAAPPMDDELPPEPLDNPRRLLVWPAPDGATQQALSDRGYRPVVVNSREEVDAQIAAYPAALFVDPLTGPITRTALQSLRTAAVAAEVPVLVTAGLGQATREAAYGADPAVLLKALAPRDSEQHPPRVLLIESQEAIARALTATLERRGMQVAHAASDADAVTLATQMRPNLVVMDLMQVRRRRAGVVDWLRANGLLNRTPLVVYTAADMDPEELPRLASGETVLFLAERSTSAEVQGRIVDLLAKIGTN